MRHVIVVIEHGGIEVRSRPGTHHIRLGIPSMTSLKDMSTVFGSSGEILAQALSGLLLLLPDRIRGSHSHRRWKLPYRPL